MSDGQEIKNRVKEEIETFQSSRSKSKSLIYSKTTASTLHNLEKVLDEILETKQFDQMTDEEFTKKFITAMGWKYHDY